MSHGDAPRAGEELLATDWFQELERAMVRLDREGAEYARGRLLGLGWKVHHEALWRFAAVRADHVPVADPRPVVRIWGFAPLAGLTIKDFCERVSRGDAPLPAFHDELGPAWDRGVVDRWIKRRGLDK
jgi:hypothetical protein